MRRDQTASRLARSGDKPPVVGITLMTRSPQTTAETLVSTATASTSTTKESALKLPPQQHQHQRVHRTFEREHSEPSDGRVRRHAQQRQGGVRSNTGSTSGGKLFDPRKDDPVRFAALRKGLGVTSSSHDAGGSASMTATHSDGRSLTSSAAPSTATLSNTSSDGRERRRRRAPGSRSTTDSGGADGSKRKGQSAAGEGSAAEGNSYVTELKRRYREMTTTEKELQEEHRLASEHLRKYQAEAASAPASGSSGGAPVVQTIGGLLARSVSMSRASDADRHGFHADGTLQHSYWLDLIAQHRKLAEAHVAFMEAALRPGLPTSLQSLPQSYKIPTRLWHTAFHSLLERFRQALPDWQACKALRDQGLSPVDRQQIHEILDLLTEYIYYAYAYYSNLLENELFKLFRSSWIENLGDIARYRMVVAKIMALLNIKDGVHHGAQRRNSDSRSARPGVVSRPKHAVEVTTDRDDHDEDDEAAEEVLDHASAKMGKDQASIGADVAMDWDLEEREIWRSTARGWYAKGLAEMPGTGRLHHHIGILSRDDDLRALYHFSKSLVTSHAYLAARESILPLFERSSQMRRVEADATLLDLFVHMHGILFTRIQLDDFGVVYERFAKQLRHYLAGDGMDGITSPSTWMMMAAINIAALQAYGAEMQSDKAEDEDCKSSPLKPAKMEAEQNKRSQRVRLDDEEDEVDADDVVDENAATTEPGNTNEAQKADVRDVVDESDALKVPCHTAKALQLAFGMLEILLSHYLDNLRHAANPYVTLILTYFSQECKQAGVLYKMERYVPWEKLVLLGNAIPSSVEPIDPRNDTSLKIRGDAVPLPEDWCLRGMAWVGRRVYERGFWRPHKVERLGLRGSLSLFESEMDMLDRCTRCPYETSEATKENRHEHGSDKGRRNDDDDDDDDDDGDDDDDLDTGRERGHDRPKLTLGLLRWKRIVHALTILIKIVPGLDFDIVDRGSSVHARHGRLVVAPPLQQKLVAWRAEEARLEVEQAIGHLKLAALEGRSSPSPESASTVKVELNAENLPEADDEGDDDEDEDERGRMGTLMHNGDDEEGEQSEEVRELMRRRSELRKQLRDSKVVDAVRNRGSTIAADSKAPGLQSKKPSFKGKPDGDATSRASGVHLVPGYTTLVLDTNVMLTPTNVVRRLVESSNWLIVVPLSVVTELDGLKRRTGDAVAQRAQEAINYLESTIKTTRRVKVQTSRGNYLTDLRFRTEDIDFTSSSGGGGSDAHDGSAPAASSSSPAAGESSARSVDDVILRCLSWQTGSHFRNRLMLFCPDDDAERQRREAQVAQAAARGDAVARAVLVTLDRNLRVKTRFRQLAAIGPSDLVDLLLDADTTKQGAQPP